MTIDASRLQSLIGARLYYRHTPCEIIEILAEGPALVVQDCSADKTIQADQYGEARRRVAQTYTVPLLNVRGDGPNPVLAELLAIHSVFEKK